MELREMPAFWINEYEVPLDLLELLGEPNLPDDLRNLIVKAKYEVDNFGAVTYPTKTNIENNIYVYKKYWDIRHGHNTKNE
jgi:hypothetical protein